MPDSVFLFTLTVKMAATAAVVVAASLIAERVGALIGALVATLPVAAGPAYILLALDHDARFIADSAVTSLAVHAATGVFCTAYVFAARRWPFPVGTGLALAAWVAGVLAVRAIDWSLAGVLVLNIATYGLCIPLVQRFAHARVPAIKRQRFDVPLRAALVAVLVGAVVTAGAHVGPRLTGILAVFPIVLMSLTLILHPRIGGEAAAAVIANTMWGLIGFGLCLLALHLAVVPLGAPAALVVALAVSLVGNTTIFFLLRHGKGRAGRQSWARSPDGAKRNPGTPS
jgi:hypothetical protein